MVEANEVLVLVVALLGIIFIFRSYTTEKKYLFITYFCLIIGFILTILEDLFFPTVLNILEHGIGVLGASLFFMLYAYQYYSKNFSKRIRRKTQ